MVCSAGKLHIFDQNIGYNCIYNYGEIKGPSLTFSKK